MSEDLQTELQKDGCDTPWSLVDNTNLEMEEDPRQDRIKKLSQIEFSACFRHNKSCKPKLLEAGLEVASRQRNLL
eukprot:7510544-Ditylum_brightwellii.AAC.1